MDIDIQGVWLALGSSAIWSAVIPVAVGGGIHHFKPWLLSEEKLDERMSSLKKESLYEELAKSLNGIFEKALFAGSLDSGDLRGKPPQKPDVIGDFIRELFGKVGVFSELSALKKKSQRMYNHLMATAIIGVVLILISLLIFPLRPYLACICYLIVFYQIVVVIKLRRVFIRFGEYEEQATQ